MTDAGVLVEPNQLLVALKPGADLGQVLGSFGHGIGHSLIGSKRNTYLLRVPAGRRDELSRLLAAHPLVRYVEVNRLRHATVGPPNDPSFLQQWALAAVQAVQAWSYIPDQYLTAANALSSRVKVAILDTGADCTHPDFMNAGGTSTDSAQGGQLVWSSSKALVATTISMASCPWQDDTGHGTHTSGSLVAATNNGVGVASLGFPLQLIVYKVLDSNGTGWDSDVATAIYDAVDAGAQVISMSLAGAGYSQSLQSAIDYAWESNVLIVPAAGDSGNTELLYPGAANHVLSVAATDATNAVAPFSTYGSWVNIAAPGVDILSTLPLQGNYFGADSYGTLSGTSMATPHVAALGGLLFMLYPELSVAAVAQRIQQTAQSPNGGWDEHIGYGVMNAGAALGDMPGPFIEGSFSGQVVNIYGNPISGAVVVAGGQSYTTTDDPSSGNSNGRFRLSNLVSGAYAVTVTAPGYSSVTVQGMIIAGADTMLTIDMAIAYSEVAGFVTHKGAGVPGAVVAAISGGLITGTAVTIATGGYALSLPAGNYILTASAPDYINASSSIQSLGVGSPTTVNISIGALGKITGTITDENNAPVPNAHINFNDGTFSGGSFTGAGGTYSTFGIPTGEYALTVSASGYGTVTPPDVNVTPDVSTIINVQFVPPIPISQTIAFGPLPNEPLSTGSFTVAAIASSRLPVGFASLTTGVCTVSGDTVTLMATGGCDIQATQAGNASYSAAAPVSESFTVAPTSQSITFNALPSQVYGTVPLTLIANATSGLVVTFNSSTTLSVCTVSGNTVTLIALGSCTIQANQSGNSTYSAATPVSQSVTVISESQSITFGQLPSQVYGASPLTVIASATSGLAVTFSSPTTLMVCTIVGNSVTIAGGGTCTIQAMQNGNTFYSAATPVTQSFTVAAASQTITFNALSNQSLGAVPFVVAATGSSNLAVNFSSQTASTCTLSGAAVTLVSLGTCTIQAGQPGNINYSAAIPVSQSFIVSGGIVITGVNSLNFPNTVVGKSSAGQVFTLQNSGNTPLTITSIATVGLDAANYRYTPDSVHPCPISPATLGAGATCILDVGFGPVLGGSHNNAQIVITDNSGNVSGSTQLVALTGTGIVLSSIAASGDTSSLTDGSSGQFAATGMYSDKSTADLTSQATWASSASNVATISPGGLATAVAPGQTNLTATVGTVTSNSFLLTVLTGAAVGISISSGSGQTATAGTTFGSSLVAVVRDSVGNAAANASVTFTAPASGASATFPNGGIAYTTATNSFGIATSLPITANSAAGTYLVVAAVAGIATTFSLTNVKVSAITVAESVATLIQGQSSIFSLTVANSANAGPTSGTVTIVLSLPNGLMVIGLNGGSTWNCNLPSSSCTTNAALSPAATSSITGIVSVALNAQGPVSIAVGVTGGTPVSYSFPILSACAVSKNASVGVTDVQQIVNQALGVSSPANDLNGDGLVNVVDLQIVVNAAMNQGCSAS